MTDTPEIQLQRTPGSIWFALFCFAFAIAAPIIAGQQAEHAQHDGWGALRVFVPWFLAAVAASFVGVICAIVGALRGPRTVLTLITAGLASLFGAGLLALFGLMAR